MVKQNLSDWQIEDARRLDRLWKERKPADMSQARFAADYDMGSQANVSLYLKGRIALNLKAVGQFAKVLRVRIDDISPTLADQVRDLYKNCDPLRNESYGVPDETREYIHRLFAEERAKHRGENGISSKPDNGKPS